MGEDRGWSLEDPASRTGAGRLAVHPGAGGLRSDPPAEAHGGGRVNVENQELAAPQAADREDRARGKASARHTESLAPEPPKPPIPQNRRAHRMQAAKALLKAPSQRLFQQPC